MSIDLMSEGTGTNTPTVENKMMASFRIEREDWGKFGEVAKRERLTVTQVLTEYIEKCIQSNRTFYGVMINTDDDVMTSGSSSTDTDEIQRLIDERISTNNDEVIRQAKDNISTSNDEILKAVDERVSAIISTLSLPTADSLDERITSALTPLQDEISKLQREIVKMKKFTSGLNQPQLIDTAETSTHPDESFSILPDGSVPIAEVLAKTGKTRQAIERLRDKGTLAELGYRAEKVGSKWRYYST